MRTYSAGEDPAAAEFEGREWVFGLLSKPRFRDRLQQLADLDLRRRPGCEPCLRALVVGDWTPGPLHHIGWCESCRRAAFALGTDAPTAAGGNRWYRRHAAWLAVAAFAVVAVPLVGSQVLDTGSRGDARGGSAVQTVPAASGDPGTTPGSTTPGSTTPVTTPLVKPVPRSKPETSGNHTSARGQKALPLTT